MKTEPFIVAIAVVALGAGGPAVAAETVLEGCQTEGCGCFHGVPEQARGAAIPAVTTIRPFTLFEDQRDKAAVLGRFGAGVTARPLGQKLVVHRQGRYRVERVQDPTVAVVPGDILHTRIDLGEGYLRLTKGDTPIQFAPNQVVFEVIESTLVSEWLAVEIDGQRGFTRDHPFETCLE